jgi:hypothetical protein
VSTDISCILLTVNQRVKNLYLYKIRIIIAALKDHTVGA